MDFLAIPFKRSLPLDLSRELGDIIERTSFQSATIFSNDLAHINQLRQCAIDPDISLPSLRDSVLYYKSLRILMDKFPRDQIEFTWFQTLSSNSISSSQYSFQWERDNILYNIAALYCLLAMDVSNDLTLQCKYFQMSAIIIKHLTDGVITSGTINLSSSNSPVMDANTLNALLNMLCAQTMECYWRKAIADKLKDKVISKLSSQIYTFYSECIVSANKSPLIRSDWINHFQNKLYYFHAATLYRMANEFHSMEKYGIEISCYLHILKLLNKYSSSKINDNSTGDKFSTVVRESLKNVERDNDYIYNQVVPSLPPDLIKPMNMINLNLPMEETLLKNVVIDEDKLNDLFARLLPTEIIESATVYKERENSYVQERIILPMNALNKLLNSELLNSSVFQRNSKLDLNNLKSVDSNFIDNFKFAFNDLTQNSENVKGLLNKIKTLLEHEQDTNNELKLKYGTLNWSLPDSNMVNKQYWDKFTTLSNYLNQGLEVDSHTMQLFEKIDINLITSEVDLPRSNDPLTNEVQDTINNRENYITRLESVTSNDTILPKLISNYRERKNTDEFESIYLDYVAKKYEQNIIYVEHEKVVNKSIIDKIRSKSKEIDELDKNDKTLPTKRLDPRDLYVEDFKYSLKLLEEVKSNIIDASKFYEDLINSLNNFSQEVDDFVNKRKLEKQQMIEKLTHTVS